MAITYGPSLVLKLPLSKISLALALIREKIILLLNENAYLEKNYLLLDFPIKNI